MLAVKIWANRDSKVDYVNQWIIVTSSCLKWKDWQQFITVELWKQLELDPWSMPHIRDLWVGDWVALLPFSPPLPLIQEK